MSDFWVLAQCQLHPLVEGIYLVQCYYFLKHKPMKLLFFSVPPSDIIQQKKHKLVINNTSKRLLKTNASSFQRNISYNNIFNLY